MSWTSIAVCNRCRRNAPNSRRVPASWLDIRFDHGAVYHFCTECVFTMLANELRKPTPNSDVTMKIGGETRRNRL